MIDSSALPFSFPAVLASTILRTASLPFPATSLPLTISGSSTEALKVRPTPADFESIASIVRTTIVAPDGSVATSARSGTNIGTIKLNNASLYVMATPYWTVKFTVFASFGRGQHQVDRFFQIGPHSSVERPGYQPAP